MSIKVLVYSLPKIPLTCNIPALFLYWPRQLKLPEVQPLTNSQFPPRFMLQMYFTFFNVEIICGFSLSFVYIYSATSYPFIFPSIIKRLPLEILKFLGATLRNQDNKVTFIRADVDVSLARSSEFMKTCHNINIIVENTVGDSYSLNGKIEMPNKTIYNITSALLLNSTHKK